MRALVFALLLVPVRVSAADDCPSGNVLAGLKSHALKGARDTLRLTDGKAPPEGDSWNTNRVSILAHGRAWVTWDLGRETTLRGLLLQGDNNDTYVLSVSGDGKTFDTVWSAPRVAEPGMRTRHSEPLEVRGRYLRVGTPKGDRSYSVGEVQAFCEMPATWPPVIERTKAGARPK